MANKKKPYKDYSDDSWFHNLMKLIGLDWCLLPAVVALMLIATGIAALAAKLL